MKNDKNNNNSSSVPVPDSPTKGSSSTPALRRSSRLKTPAKPKSVRFENDVDVFETPKKPKTRKATTQSSTKAKTASVKRTNSRKSSRTPSTNKKSARTPLMQDNKSPNTTEILVSKKETNPKQTQARVKGKLHRIGNLRRATDKDTYAVCSDGNSNVFLVDDLVYKCAYEGDVDNFTKEAIKYSIEAYHRDFKVGQSLSQFMYRSVMNLCDGCKWDATQLSKIDCREIARLAEQAVSNSMGVTNVAKLSVDTSIVDATDSIPVGNTDAKRAALQRSMSACTTGNRTAASTSVIPTSVPNPVAGTNASDPAVLAILQTLADGQQRDRETVKMIATTQQQQGEFVKIIATNQQQQGEFVKIIATNQQQQGETLKTVASGQETLAKIVADNKRETDEKFDRQDASMKEIREQQEKDRKVLKENTQAINTLRSRSSRDSTSSDFDDSSAFFDCYESISEASPHKKSRIVVETVPEPSTEPLSRAEFEAEGIIMWDRKKGPKEKNY